MFLPVIHFEVPFPFQLPIMDNSFAPMKNDLIIRAAWGELLPSKLRKHSKM